jgi:hypothetical protein
VQKFPDRANLVLQWSDPDTGKRRSKTAGTRDRNLAELRRADLEAALNSGVCNSSRNRPQKTTDPRAADNDARVGSETSSDDAG